jgi:hypothetical protein
MRRLLLVCALVSALAAPAVALALPQSTGDGTLAVRNASGDTGQVAVWLNVSGAVVAQVASGKILIDDFSTSDAYAPVVTGAERQRDLPSGATLYAGLNIRLRAIGGHYRIRILGHGIDVNVVGQGTARLTGSPFLTNDGRYSVNGGPWVSMPDFGKPLDIGA